MVTKIMNVFYGADCLPYKDVERQVHFPIVGNSFLGASNTTEIRFYIGKIGSEDDTWVANSKLPNGKMGNEILETLYDSELQEWYAKLQFGSFYTQAKGDVFISLNAFDGGVQVVGLDENGQETDDPSEIVNYSITGTPTIQATGVVKIAVNYATPLIDGEEENVVTLASIYAEVGTKLNKNSSHYLKVVNNINQINTATYADYLNADDIVYSKANQTFYSLSKVGGVFVADEIALDLSSLVVGILNITDELNVPNFSYIYDGNNVTLVEYIEQTIATAQRQYFTLTSSSMSLTDEQIESLEDNPNTRLYYDNTYYDLSSKTGTQLTYFNNVVTFTNDNGSTKRSQKIALLNKTAKRIDIATTTLNFYNKSQADTLLSGKQDTLTFDNEPTTGSSNPVKSGGVKSYVDTAKTNLQNAINLKQDKLTAGAGITITSGNVISSTASIKFEIVSVLPATGDDDTFYLVAHSGSEQNNYYDEYVYVNGAWELIGTTQVDLTDYITTTELATALNDYYTKSQIDVMLQAVQDKLPNPINGRYLRTNSLNGELEWEDVIQDISTNAIATLNNTDWTDLKNETSFVVDSVTISGIDTNYNFIKVKVSINSNNYYVVLTKNNTNNYVGIFNIEEDDYLYEIGLYYNGSQIILRSSTYNVIPTNAIVGAEGNVIVDISGNYIITTEV